MFEHSDSSTTQVVPGSGAPFYDSFGRGWETVPPWHFTQELADLTSAVAAMAAQPPGSRSDRDAVADTELLVRLANQLQVAVLSRLAVIDKRGVTREGRCGSLAGWVGGHDLDVPASQVTLARRLPGLLTGLLTVADALAQGALSLTDAGRVASEVEKVRGHVDRPDGSIDRQDGELLLAAVIGDGLREALWDYLGGLEDAAPARPAGCRARRHPGGGHVPGGARVEAASCWSRSGSTPLPCRPC